MVCSHSTTPFGLNIKVVYLKKKKKLPKKKQNNRSHKTKLLISQPGHFKHRQAKQTQKHNNRAGGVCNELLFNS